MYSLRRWLYRPKRSDSSLLAQFYFADEELNLVAAELDSFEGRKDPERCTAMVNQLRACQARVLNVVSQMMDETVKEHRALRDFRVKFPDDVIQENLAGQLWFGAECLAAGSSIMNREIESACMRPLARALTKNLDSLRTILREQCLQSVHDYTETIKESLIIFDKLFAEFELSYVSAMVPVKTAHEYDMIQEITVLFSETVQRALKIGLLKVDMIDEYDPALMFTIPRLAIICGLLINKDGPLNPDNDPWNISEMFRPFQTLLLKIRELLQILTESELMTLERALCSQEEPSYLLSLEEKKKAAKEERRKVSKEKKREEKLRMSEGDDGSIESELAALEIAERLEALALNFETSRNSNTGGVDQREADTQSKTSEESSASSTALSEGEVVSASQEVSTEERIRRFTQQLYREIDMDSMSLQENDTIANPINNISPQVIFDMPNSHHSQATSTIDEATATSDSLNSQSTESTLTAVSLPNSTTDAEQIEGASVEQANSDNKYVSVVSCESDGSDIESVGKDMSASSSSNSANSCSAGASPDKELVQSSITKCISTDSGLHSEVLSLSSSMFTISSSGSQQQITSPDTPMSPGLPGTEFVLEARSEDSSDDTIKGKETEAQVERTESPEKDESNAGHSTDVRSGVDGAGIAEHSHSASTQDEVSSLETNNSDGLKQQTGASTHEVNSCDTVVQTSFTEAENHSCHQAMHLNNQNCQSNGSSTLSCNNNNSSSSPLTTKSHSNSEDAQNNNSAHDTSSKDTCQESSSTPVQHSVLPVTSVLGSNPQQPIPTAINSTEAPEINGASNSDTSCVPPSPLASTSESLQAGNASTTATTGERSGASEAGSQKPNTNVDSGNLHTVNNITSSVQTSTNTPQLNTQHESASTSRPTSVKKEKTGSTSGKSKIRKNSALKGTAQQSTSRAQRLVDKHILDGQCSTSSETSSYTSDCGDQEEIALAIEAVETITRQQVRARFTSSSDMIHRLFVCISGVADQLQTNFAGDLRNILRSVFDINCSEPVDISEGDKTKDTTPLGAAYIAISNASRSARRNRSDSNNPQRPPTWVPDEQTTECMSCQVPFSFVRRRHHCRNCGKIFCHRCSSNFVPLPHYGQEKCVRVCNRCYMFRVTPFTVRPSTQ